jgi:hypothetical protein
MTYGELHYATLFSDLSTRLDFSMSANIPQISIGAVYAINSILVKGESTVMKPTVFKFWLPESARHTDVLSTSAAADVAG